MDNNYKCDLVKMGKHISELRKNKGLTQKKLAEIIEVNDKSISKWEQGDLAPDITVLKPLAIALDVKVEEILCGEKIEEKEKKETPEQKKKRIKRKIIKLLVSIIILGLVILFFKHDSWTVTELKYNDKNIFVEGMIISNESESKLIISKIKSKNNQGGTLDELFIKKINIIVINKTDEIFKMENELESAIPLSKYISSYSFAIDNTEKLKKENIKITISYDDINNIKHFLDISF